jgi:hypothetical protein
MLSLYLMELDLITNKLDLKYYKGLRYFLSKNGIELDWLNEYIEILCKKIQDDKNSESLTEKKKEQTYQIQSSETENHKQIFSDEELYKKPWVKLNSIHKILKIKEFVNNLKIDSEQDRVALKDELVTLVKIKILTKKEKVKYDEVNGKIISLTNLQYKNCKYFYCNE